jgi:hypothetical protein
MNNLQLISCLKEIKDDSEKFAKIAKKYPIVHNHYKDNLKKFKLSLTGKLKRIKLLKLSNTSEIECNILAILSISCPLKQNCDILIDKINYFIQDLELEEDSFFGERIYDKNSRFGVHVDIKNLVESAKKELFIVEPFVTDHLLELTLKDIDKNLKINILTNSNNAITRGKFTKLSPIFGKQHINGYEVRESEDIHDRVIFTDNENGWIIGQSINHAGNKPTYLIKLKDSKKLENIYKKIWNNSKKI